MRRFGRVLAAVMFVLAAFAGAAWFLARPAVPSDFYSQAFDLSAGGHGRLLASETFTKAVPVGAKAWRILYETRRHDQTPTLGSAIIFASATAAPAPRPVIGWAHGTTGIVGGCAPSVMKNPLANVPAVGEALAAGWAIVAPDYPGLGTPGGHHYLVGREAAFSMLDGLAAALEVEDAQLGKATVIWGHSQGGNTALWTAAKAATTVKVDILGAAALAPASDLPGLVERAAQSMFGKIVSAYLINAYAAAYPDVVETDYVSPVVRWITADIARRCVGEIGTLLSVAQAALLPAAGIFSKSPMEGALRTRLAENSPKGPFHVPILIAQGLRDDLVYPEVQAGYVRTQCEEGTMLTALTFDDRDHVSLVAPGSPLNPPLMAWTAARFAGDVASVDCGN
jgi:pimeloyl-ACP methyl ester carboxylesterase